MGFEDGLLEKESESGSFGSVDHSRAWENKTICEGRKGRSESGRKTEEKTRERTKSLRNERRGSVSSRCEDDHSNHLPNLMEHEGLSVESEGDPFGSVEDDGITDLRSEKGTRLALFVDASDRLEGQ